MGIPTHSAVLACLFTIAWAAPARAAVDVTFVHPEHYSDAALRSGRAEASAALLDDIRRHLERLGARYLEPAQVLKVDVLDIDLAGRFEPWRPLSSDVRVMRAVDWPRIDVRYTLEEGGRILVHAQESIADLNYQMRPAARLSSDPLRYEKAMLDDWFRTRFAKYGPRPG